MSYSILGISGSPVTSGNVDTFLGSIMDMALEKGLDTETINLSKMEIKNCVHCYFCLSKQKQGKYCSLEDDAQLIFEKLERTDIIISSPEKAFYDQQMIELRH